MIRALTAPLLAKFAGGAALAALAFAGVQSWRLDRVEDLLAEARAALVFEVAAHRATKDAYAQAQADAARAEAERNARVAAQQKEITDAITTSYRRALADAHARAERLRQPSARAGAAGAARGADLPGLSAAAGGAAGASVDNRLPAAPAPDELDWRLIATRQALQLEALIDWTEAQAAVEPSAATPAEDAAR